MTFRELLGIGAGGGFALGPVQNTFDAVAGNRAAAEALRDAYATANPTWLAQYVANSSLNILLLYTESGDSIGLFQVYAGGAWRDNSSARGVRGTPGAGTDFSGISDNHLPAIGPAPDKAPYDSGLVVDPDTGDLTTGGVIQSGPTGQRLGPDFSLANGMQTLQLTLGDGTKALVVAREYDDTGSMELVSYDLGAIEDFNINTANTQAFTDPHEFMYTTTLDTVISNVEFIPNEAGTLRLQAWAGTDATGRVLFDETRVVTSAEVGTVTAFNRGNDYISPAASNIFVRLSGIALRGGTGQTGDAMVGQLSVYLVANVQRYTRQSVDQGWSPIFAVVTDSERRVLQVSSWTGGTGTPPTSGVYLGSTGFVTDIAQAVDIRGAQGVAGMTGADGDDGWSPAFAVVTDGERRVLQVSSWVGGTGTPPASGQYVGSTGLVTDIAQAIDIRGAAGTSGGTGTDGDDGWSPILAAVSDNERRVLQVSSWTGGTGTPPASGQYIGSTGLVTAIADAVDIRGEAGADGTGAVTQIVPRSGNVVFANADNGSFNVFNITTASVATLPDSTNVDDDFLIHVFNGSGANSLNLVGTSNQTITVYENNASSTGTSRTLSNRTAYVIEKIVPAIGLNRWRAAPLSSPPAAGHISDFAIATSENIPLFRVNNYDDLVGTWNVIFNADAAAGITFTSLQLNGQALTHTITALTDGFNQYTVTINQAQVDTIETANDIPNFSMTYTPGTGLGTETINWFVDIGSVQFMVPTLRRAWRENLNFGQTATFNLYVNRIAEFRENVTIVGDIPMWSDPDWDTSANDVFAFVHLSTSVNAIMRVRTQGLDFFETTAGVVSRQIDQTMGDRGYMVIRDPTTIGRFLIRDLPADAPGMTGTTAGIETPVNSYAPVAFPAGVPFLVDGSLNQLFLVNDPIALSDEQNIHGFVPAGGIDASDGVTPTEFTPIRNGSIEGVDFGLETYTAGSPVYLSKAPASLHYLTANPAEPNIIAICGVITDHVAGTIYNIYVSVDLFQWSYAQRNYDGINDTVVGTQAWSSNQINQLHRTFVLSSDQVLTDNLFATHRDFYVIAGGHTVTLNSVTYPNYQWFCHVLASDADVSIVGTGTIIGPTTIPEGHTALILMDPLGSSYYVTLMSQRPNLFMPDAAGRTVNVRRSLLSGEGVGTSTDEISDFIGLTILPSDRRRVDLFFTEVGSETLRNLVLRRFFDVATDGEVETIATETIRLSSAEFFNSYALVDYTPTNLNQTYFFVGYGYFTSPTPRLLYNGADTTTGKLNAVYQANTTHELVIRELNGGWHIISCDRDISGGWTDGSEADATLPTSIHSLGANEQSLTVTSGPDEGTVHYYPPESDVGITFTGTLGSITYPPVHTQLFNSKRGALYAFSRLDDAVNGVYTASMRFLFKGTHTADDVNILRTDLDATLARTIDASGNTVPGKIETDEIMTARATFQELLLHNLPTTQPTEMGVVWNDSGTLKIS